MEFKGYKNLHKGEKCWILGNGPSLKNFDFSILKGEYVFGTNRIYLADYVPNFYVAVNPLVIEQFHDDINLMDCEKFIAARFVQDGTVTNAIELYSSTLPCFSRHPDDYVYEGHTVTYVCLQLAYFMGFTTVLLVGVDHSFEFEGDPNALAKAEGKDVNHFHPDYFADGTLWHNPDLEQSERAYRMAKTVFDDDGRRIINLTPNTNLFVFERGEIAEW